MGYWAEMNLLGDLGTVDLPTLVGRAEDLKLELGKLGADVTLITVPVVDSSVSIILTVADDEALVVVARLTVASPLRVGALGGGGTLLAAVCHVVLALTWRLDRVVDDADARLVDGGSDHGIGLRGRPGRVRVGLPFASTVGVVPSHFSP